MPEQDCPNGVMQIGSSILSAYLTVYELSFESKGFKEELKIYLLTSIKAKLNWIPFGHLLENNQLTHHLDFHDIRLPKKGSKTLNRF